MLSNGKVELSELLTRPPPSPLSSERREYTVKQEPVHAKRENHANDQPEGVKEAEAPKKPCIDRQGHRSRRKDLTGNTNSNRTRNGDQKSLLCGLHAVGRRSMRRATCAA